MNIETSTAKMNVKTSTTEALEKRLGEVLGEMANIRVQLDDAKGDAAANGDYSDRDWFNAARHALRMKGREQQLIQLELGNRKRKERRERENTFERAFMRATYDRFGPTVYAELIECAHTQK